MVASMITQAKLKAVLRYDSHTGNFLWRMSGKGRGVKEGTKAGRYTQKGYWRITINGETYRAHRLAWLYMTGEWPKDQIDHINGVKDDNRWVNLRPATNSQNHANKPLQSNNTSGYKGVSWDSRQRRWCAYIKKNGIRHHLGYYDTAKDAHSAYAKKSQELFGAFARAA